MVVNCERVWQEVSNYLEGDVDAPLRAAMDDHFHACPRCHSVLEGTRNVIRLYGDERMMEAPSGFGRRLEKRLARNTRAAKPGWFLWLVPVAALALIAGGLQLARSFHHPPQPAVHNRLGEHIPPDLVVVVSPDSKVFHVAGCDLIQNKDNLRTLTAKQALEQGYVPCTRCLRKYLSTSKGGSISLPDHASPEADSDEADLDEPHGGQ